MVISLVYMPTILAVECVRENSNGRIVRHCLVRLAMKLVVAQYYSSENNLPTFRLNAPVIISAKVRNVGKLFCEL